MGSVYKLARSPRLLVSQCYSKFYIPIAANLAVLVSLLHLSSKSITASYLDKPNLSFKHFDSIKPASMPQAWKDPELITVFETGTDSYVVLLEIRQK